MNGCRSPRVPTDVRTIFRMECRKHSARAALLLEPAILAEPLRHDVFGAFHHRHPLVERMLVRAAVRIHIVPGKQKPALWRDPDAGLGKPCRATFLDLVEIDHRGPGALAAIRLHGGPIFFALMEKVMMRAKMLAGRVTLALHR